MWHSFSSSSFQVPEVLHVLYSRMQTVKKDTHRRLLLHSVYILACFHHEPVVESLLQKRLPMDRSVHSHLAPL